MAYEFNKLSILQYAICNKEHIKDRYDLEGIHASCIKKVIKKYSLYNMMYGLGLIKSYVWPENLGMICDSLLECNMINEFQTTFEELMMQQCNNGGWGLPIVWHSGEYIFPPNTMMSTTTAEILDRIYYWCKEGVIDECYKEYHKEGLKQLHDSLNISYEDEKKMIFSYTPLDKYRVINSNLLVASALSKDEEGKYEREIQRILYGIKDAVRDSGKFTYFYDCGRVDAYHQAFCLKALLELEKEYPVAKELYDSGMWFLMNNMIDTEGNVFVTPDSNVVDLHGVADVLALFNLNGDIKMYNKVYSRCKNSMFRDGKLYQYAYYSNGGTYKLHTEAFGRQGYLRIMSTVS